MKRSCLFSIIVLLALAPALSPRSAGAQDQASGPFKVGEAPPPQDVYTKVNLTEPYDIVAGFTLFPSLTSPDLFYYVPKPRVARTREGRLVFRLLSYAMAENRNQVGSADVAGGYLQFDVVMSPTPEEEQEIKKQLLNPPRRFGPKLLARGAFLAATAASVHPYNQTHGPQAKPKNVRLAPIPIHNLKAKARIPGVKGDDKTDTDWYQANGDASGTTTFALNLSGPQSIALYQAVMNPAAVEPFNVYFSGELGGYIKCKAKLTVRTSEIFTYIQKQMGSATRITKPGSRGISLFGLVNIGGSASQTKDTDIQVNDIDVTQILNTAIKIEGDLQGYDDTLMAMAKYGLDLAMARFGTPIPLEDLIDPQKELKEPRTPPKGSDASLWAYLASWHTGGIIGPGRSRGTKAYYGYYDDKSLDQYKAATFSVDLDKQIAVTWQFSPSSSIFDDTIVKEIQSNASMYAQKMALNDPFFEKLDITYAANLDFVGGPFSKVVFTDIFKLKDGADYSVAGLLLETKDSVEKGTLVNVVPPSNLRFSGLLQGNLYQGPVGGAFNILDPSARRTALSARKWPTFADGTKVKGITHRWKYQVYFRPSVKDQDFPPSWTSDEAANSETVLVATIPPKVAVFTVTGDGLAPDKVLTAMVTVRYKASLKFKGQDNAETVKSVTVRPGEGDKRIYFYDDNPKANLPCEYQFVLVYQGGKQFKTDWFQSEGGMILVYDPNM